MKMKNLLALGCSNSHWNWGKSWPDFVAEYYNFNLIRASSCGAGNAMFIEKIHMGLQENKIDLVVIQLTEPSRVVLGFQQFEYKSIADCEYNDGNRIDDIGYYTWNVNNNEYNIFRETGKKVIIDDFWSAQISTSRWIDYKVMQDMLLMQTICEQYNVPCVFFSWFVPMENLFIKKYEWFKQRINYIPSCAAQWLNNNQVPIIHNDGHYNTEGHYKLTSSWLIPELHKLNKIKDFITC